MKTTMLFSLRRITSSGALALALLFLDSGAVNAAQPPGNITGPLSQTIAAGDFVNFNVNVGSGDTPMTFQWQFNGSDIPGATSSSLHIDNVQPSNAGNYRVNVSNSAGTTTSATATLTMLAPPTIVSQNPQPLVQRVIGNGGAIYLTVTVQDYPIAALLRYPLTYKLLFMGNIIEVTTSSATANTFYNVFSVPANEGYYSVIVQNAAGSVESDLWTVWFTTPGCVMGWGKSEIYGETVPFGVTGAAAIAAGGHHCLVLTEDGFVWGFGKGDYGQLNVPTGLSDVVAIAAGGDHSLALKGDGTVAVWGDNSHGQLNVPGNLSGVVAIAAGYYHSLALKSDGTVVAWGESLNGQISIPPGLSGVISIAGGGYHSLALKSDGTIIGWGNNSFGQASAPPGLSGVVGIAGGVYHSLALKNDGTIVAWGFNDYGQATVPAGLNSVMSVAAGGYHSLALKNDGTVVAWGLNGYGQATVPAGVTGIKSISGGLLLSLALEFSPTIQYYPVDVTKDLLLIYNSSFADSIALKDYYLANRPAVSGANVLGIPVTTQGAIPGYADPDECITSANYNSQLLAGFTTWLNGNPTKRPEYVVLFLKIPAKFDNGVSVSYSLSQAVSGYRPYITHINMGDPYDHSGQSDLIACKAYIDKLKFIGDTYSAGKVVISASRGGYGNNHYYFDDGTTHGSYTIGTDAENAVLAADPTATVTHADYGGTAITSGLNVAGYLSWGVYNPGLAGGDYALPPLGTGKIAWTQGNSGWYIIETIESYNGFRFNYGGQGTFLKWFSTGAFGGVNYSNTPVGAVSHVEEPWFGGQNDETKYFGLWASGKNFAICAWVSRRTQVFQAVGDPLVAR